MVERSGNSVPGGVATFGPLTVMVTTAAGKPVSGVTVNFVCTPASPAIACQLNPGGGGGVPATTNAHGHAVLNQMGGNSVSVYYGGGPVTINVTGNSFAGVAFTLTALTPTPAPVAVVTNPTLTITGGNNQTHQRAGSSVPGGVANFTPLTVQLKNGAGQPVSGVPVTFTCHVPGQWACQTDPSGASRGVMQMTTNSSGVATTPQRYGGQRALDLLRRRPVYGHRIVSERIGHVQRDGWCGHDIHVHRDGRFRQQSNGSAHGHLGTRRNRDVWTACRADNGCQQQAGIGRHRQLGVQRTGPDGVSTESGRRRRRSVDER